MARYDLPPFQTPSKTPAKQPVTPTSENALTRIAFHLYRKLDFDFDRAATAHPQISSDPNIPHGSSTDGHSDILSDYDDTASQQSSPDISTGSPFAATPHQHDLQPSSFGGLRMFAPKPQLPNLKLDKVDSAAAKQSEKSADASKLNKPLPKSPSSGSVIANIFGWGNSSPSATEFSSIPSPSTPTHAADARLLPASDSGALSVANSNVSSNPLGYCESYLSTPPPQISAASVQIDEMEDELKAIGSELASSIRREIDLEDLVERLQEQINNPQAPNKRTSDYFSDSGYSSAKLSDYDHSREEIDKIQRRSEQEKASLRLELTNKLQDERSKRKDLDQQVKDLQERASQIDLAHMNNMDVNGRLKELETTCEDLRRKLSEERASTANFEGVLSALKTELKDASNERDNLRDEVVPQLRARVEGLEAEAASHASLTYESTKMQHQLQSLQEENSTLRNSTAGVEDVMARGLSMRSPLARTDAKNYAAESREALAERLKDVEAQRDALHNALKNLLERQEFQNRENEKKIKLLEKERQRLLSDSPKKAGFERDITKLRTEVNVLRRRAEDALEQKWQVEKGLGGLKMDLDRAEEEIATLRGLLNGKDILNSPSDDASESSVNSLTLQKAYDDLQAQYNESIERIKKLEDSTGAAQDEKTKLALKRLEKSLNAALSQRDSARPDVDGLQSQYDKLGSTSDRGIADELTVSAARVEQLASQVRSQLAANAELRQRLSETVTRGDSDRKANSDRIAELQERLRVLEDDLVNAQSSSEDSLGRHEEEISKLKAAHSEQLRRLQDGDRVGMTGPRKGSILNSPAGSVFARAQSISAKSFEDQTQVKKLRERVSELERALSDTESEMQEVVGKMNTAQIEVMNLQEERETALRETKRLQTMVKQESTSAFASQLRMFGLGGSS